jgi:lipopolysaccharide transport system ATP-binding protein
MSSDGLAIRAERLSKRYRLGERQRYRTLREALASVAVAPFRRRRAALPETIWALREVSFEIRHGEVVGVIGRNGAGKSTLLKILSRITEPTSGRAELHGRIGSLLEVGTGFHSELTGRENIFLSGAILGMRRAEIERKFDEIVAFAEVERFIDTPVKRYSSGMYLRLAFAVAAHLDPEILLVDEVLAVGDASFQKRCLGKMSNVAREGRTVLFVSHNMGAVTSLCPRAIHLREGGIHEDGPSGRVVANYLAGLLEGDDEDLARYLLAGMGKEARIVAARLHSPDGRNVLFGDPVEVELTVEADRSFDGMSVGSSIFDVAGNCVGTLFTRETFSAAPDLRIQLRLRVSGLSLAPGLYHLGLSIGRGGRDSGRQDLDIVIGRPAFQVLPVSASDETVADWQRTWGSIVIRECSLSVERQEKR